MKIVIFGLAGILSFVGSLVAALAVTGNLSKESLQRLMQKEVVLEEEMTSVSDGTGELAKLLAEKLAAVEQRERELTDRAAQQDQREESIRADITRLEQLLQGITGSLETEQADRAVRIKTLATSIAEMDEDKAALLLQEYPPEDAAEILLDEVVTAEIRGGILDEMPKEFAAQILLAFRDKGL